MEKTILQKKHLIILTKIKMWRQINSLISNSHVFKVVNDRFYCFKIEWSFFGFWKKKIQLSILILFKLVQNWFLIVSWKRSSKETFHSLWRYMYMYVHVNRLWNLNKYILSIFLKRKCNILKLYKSWCSLQLNFNELISLIQNTGVSLQQRFLRYQRTDIVEFFDTLQNTPLTIIKWAFVNVSILSLIQKA